MATKSKTGISGLRQLTFKPGPPKSTSIGDGQHSKPRRRGRKKYRGQGR
jgi:hypothetical protein